MSDNKFILKLKGTQTPKSVVEIKNDKLVAPFVNVPHSSDAVGSIIQDTDSSVVVAKSAQNWKLNGNSLAPATNLTGDGGDYTGEYAVSGSGAWVNASYVFPNTGDPNNPTAAIFNAHTKWVLRLCGKNLLSDNGDTITFSFIVKIGSTNIMAKTITVRKSANFFCAQFVGDFSESAQTIIKAQQGQALTVQLLCADATASATIYNGMTVLTALQRRVDSDAVSSNTRTFDDLEETVNDLVVDIDTKVNIDGSSIMTGPLKFRAGSFEGAIAGGLGDGISIYKLKADGSIDSEVASLTKTNGFIPGTNNSTDIGRNNVKWKDAYIARVITAVLNNGANINVPTTGGTLGLNDFSNITDSAKNISNWSTNVTNCITEIPQDINLELNNGTLTLKSGSKLYVPNGSGTFDILTLTADKTATQTANDTRMYLYNGSYIEKFPLSQCYSGDTAPSGQTYMFWYDMVNNLMKMTTDGGSTWTSGWSLPFCIATASGGALTSIDQVFNGFGYIGSTVFALPGVTLVKPDGRNTDGTLKNVISTITSVRTNTTYRPNTNGYLIYAPAGQAIQKSAAITNWYYDKNRNVVSSLSGDTSWMIWGAYTTDANDKITSFEPKTAFHAVDYSDTEYIAHQAMPSGRYVDLTLPASDGTITAPADGFLYLNKVSSASGQRIKLNNTNGTEASMSSWSSASSQALETLLLVSKGDVIRVNYNAGGTTNYFRFIYANGAK